MKPTLVATLLVLLLAPIADAAGKTAGMTHTHKAPITHAIVDVEITSADVSTDLIGSTTEAMSDSINQKSRLQTLSQEAAAKGQTCVITHHTRVFDNLRVPQNGTTAVWSIPVSNSLYTYPGKTKGPATVRRVLTLNVTPRLNSNKTITMHFYVWKHQIAVIPQGSPLKPHVNVWGHDDLLTFHSGETKGFSIHYPGDSIQHLVFATVTLQSMEK